MSDELNNGKREQPRVRARDLMCKHRIGSPDQVNLKRERFLAMLKSRNGYTNVKAVDELERLLKQFYRANRSLNIHRRPSIGHPLDE